MRLIMIGLIITISSMLMGMSYNNTSYIPMVNNITLGSSMTAVEEHFGKPLAIDNDIIANIPVQYYHYKNGNRIGLDPLTHTVIDIIIPDATYTENNKIQVGATNYFIQELQGRAKRQRINGQTYLLYRSGESRLWYRLDPQTMAVSYFRLTTLPIEEDFGEDSAALDLGFFPTRIDASMVAPPTMRYNTIFPAYSPRTD